MLTLLLACTPADPSATKDSAEPATALAVSVSPAAVEFGAVLAGEVARQTVTVVNSGEDTVRLTNLQLSGAGDPFVLAALESDLLLPGATSSFTVAFAPLSLDRFEEELRVETDAPEAPSISVALRGQGQGPALSLSPETVDSTGVYLGCSRSTPIEVRNEGSTPLSIRSIDYSSGGPEFSVELQESGPLPWILEAGELRQVWTTYTPADVGEDSAALLWDSDDPLHPLRQVSIHASSVVFQTVEDTFLCSAGCELFSLTAQPLPDRIRVEVDNLPLSEGWQYLPADNQIQFLGDAIPQPGSTIRVTYDQQGDCGV